MGEEGLRRMEKRKRKEQDESSCSPQMPLAIFVEGTAGHIFKGVGNCDLHPYH